MQMSNIIIFVLTEAASVRANMSGSSAGFIFIPEDVWSIMVFIPEDVPADLILCSGGRSAGMKTNIGGSSAGMSFISADHPPEWVLRSAGMPMGTCSGGIYPN